MSRPSWDDTFFAVAETFAARGTCPRLHTAAVAVNELHQILAVGYNGSRRGEPHCEDVGCDMVDGHCLRTAHAEQNLVASATLNHVSLAGATIYILHTPCRPCQNLLAAARVGEIKHQHPYRDSEALHARGLPDAAPQLPRAGRTLPQ